VSRVRWNEPRYVEESQQERYFDGQRWVARLDWYLTDEDIQLIREGRKCVQCMEVFRHTDGSSLAWPDRCEVCGYEVAARQRDDLNADYMGEIRVGPTSSDSDEIDRMEYESASRIWTPGRSALIPKDLKGD
jgi:hypothetical protein